MARYETLHRALRAVLGIYPWRFGAAWLNRRLDRLFEGPQPNWLVAPGKHLFPTMVLNVSINLQRKLFYFPKVYGNFYGRSEFARFIEQALEPGGVFVDIGSNVGFFTLLAAKRVGPTGHVYAFEPEPDICESLRRSRDANGLDQLETFQIALSDHDGEASFYRATDGTASSLVPEVPERAKRYERVLTTPVTTLDALVAAGKLPRKDVSLVKVDVEGEEVRTVRGMKSALVACGKPKIWCEVRGPEGSTRSPNTYPTVRDELATIGYAPFIWDAGALRPVADDDVRGRADVLFVA